MGETSIEWTATVRPDGTIAKGYTFNAWEGCAKVHTGCKNCYAETRAKRFGQVEWGPHGTRMLRSEAYWREPIKWNAEAEKAGERRRVFCSSLADVFEDWNGRVIDHRGDVASRNLYAERDRLFALIDATPHLDWLLLTKRPQQIPHFWRLKGRDIDYGVSPYFSNLTHEEVGESNEAYYRQNVWLLTSVSDQATAEAMVPELLKCRGLAPVLGVSAEPLLGPIDFDKIGNALFDRDRAIRKAMNGPQSLNFDQADSVVDYPMLDWVIVGGESGPGARPCDIDWIRSIRDQCAAASAPCFIKQLGANNECDLQDGKGGDINEWPEDLRVRQFPKQEPTNG